MKIKILFILLALTSCANRKVVKNTQTEKTETESVVKQNVKTNDSTSAKSTAKIVENSFEIEPVQGVDTRLVYVKGKDTVRVITNGKVKFLNKETNTANEVVNVKKIDDNKESKEVKSVEKKVKDTNIDKKSNPFQFILIGIIIAIVFMLLINQVKKKFLL